MYYIKKPFGFERENLNSALICSTIANVHRSKGKSAYTVSDFMFKDAEQAEKAKITKTMAAMDALVIRKNKAAKNGA